MIKSDEELMLKALKFLPELQGLSVLDALRTLELLESILKQLQTVSISDDILQTTTEEWRNAVKQSL